MHLSFVNGMDAGNVDGMDDGLTDGVDALGDAVGEEDVAVLPPPICTTLRNTRTVPTMVCRHNRGRGFGCECWCGRVRRGVGLTAGSCGEGFSTNQLE